MAWKLQCLSPLLAVLPILISAQPYANNTDPTVTVDYHSSSASASSHSESATIELKTHSACSNVTNAANNSTTPASRSFARRAVKAYFAAYNADADSVSKIRYDLYDELIFFVATTTQDFTVGFGNMTQTAWDSLAHEFVRRCEETGVVPTFSIGGWTGSIFFSPLVATAENRTAYADSLVKFAKNYGFHGIDIDWEYPSVQGIGCNIINDDDVTNYQLFLKQIKETWPEGKLSTAVHLNGIRDSNYAPVPAENLTTLVNVVDSLKVMAYDVFGAWSSTTGPIGAINGACAPEGLQFSVQTAVARYLDQGFSPNQLILGIPGYAKTWNLQSSTLVPKQVQNFTTYYYQNVTGVPQGGRFDDAPGVDVCGQTVATWGGSWLVNELIQNEFLSEDQTEGRSGFVRHFDPCSGLPFLTRDTTFIAYDDIFSTTKKARYAKTENLGGIYFFDSFGPADATVQAARDVFA